jgi:UDP-N-acetylmuramate dehydrogenase
MAANGLFLKAQVVMDEPMFATPQDEQALKELLDYARQEAGMPVFFIGGGTNLLVSDAPVHALVISSAGFQGLSVLDENKEGATIEVPAGLPLKAMLSFCMQKGLGGLEELWGIPGSVGGAVRGNAGAFGKTMKDSVQNVTVMAATGEVKRVIKSQLGFSYRDTTLPDGDFILSVRLAFTRDDPERIKKRMDEFFTKKRNSQPLTGRSAGCVFKNPEGGLPPAGKLIDEAGLKGARRGDIEVSGVHANFFVNRGRGTAEDFVALMDTVRDTVFENTGFVLQPEIRTLPAKDAIAPPDKAERQGERP